MLPPNKLLKEITFQFLKNYKRFKKGMYLRVPYYRFTGQIKLEEVHKELRQLLKNKIIKLCQKKNK